MKKYHKQSLLNISGHKFIAILNDGTEQVCIVQKDKTTGMHYVRGVKWEDFEYWRPLDESNQ